MGRRKVNYSGVKRLLMKAPGEDADVPGRVENELSLSARTKRSEKVTIMDANFSRGVQRVARTRARGV